MIFNLLYVFIVTKFALLQKSHISAYDVMMKMYKINVHTVYGTVNENIQKGYWCIILLCG